MLRRLGLVESDQVPQTVGSKYRRFDIFQCHGIAQRALSTRRKRRHRQIMIATSNLNNQTDIGDMLVTTAALSKFLTSLADYSQKDYAVVVVIVTSFTCT